MATKTLNKSEIKQLNSQLQELYGKAFFTKKESIQIHDKPIKHIRLNKTPILFFKDETPIPTLKLLLKDQILKKVTVDMGAVKFICGGADVMRPGIIQIDDNIKKGDIITVLDEKNKTPLVIGEAKYSSEELKEKQDGKVIKNIHYVSDELWQLE